MTHTTTTLSLFSALVVTAVGLVACASTGPSGLDTGTTATIVPAGAPTAMTASAAAGSYQLSADELELDCKKLSGRMQIRILEIRDFHERATATFAARALQSGATSVFGGPSAGTDPKGAYARDRAMLDAYNRQLIAKGCKSYDLDAELKPKHFKDGPSATVKQPAGQAAPAKAAR